MMSRSCAKRGNNKAENEGKPAKRKKKDYKVDVPSDDCPVLIQRIGYGVKKTAPSISLTPALDDLMHPMSTEDFLETCFRKKAVHITCKKGDEDDHAENRVSGLCDEMCGLESEAILRETSSDSIFVWLRGKGNNGSNHDTNKNDFVRSIEVADADTAIALHKTAGHATYCRAPPKVEQRLVSSLLRATGLGCGQYDPSGESMVSMGTGEVETFISTDGHLTNWHFDFQENFTIQLSGTKRWTIQQGTIQDPIRGCTPHYAAPEAVEAQLKAAHLFDRKFRFGFPEKGVTARGDVVSVDVKPGDVFYFPAGMWHKVETIEPGVSINVSLMASNYATVTCRALQHLLYKDKRWREPVLNNPTKNAVNHLKDLLKELPSLIQGLERHGAEAIIPPVLQHPPRFRLVAGDDEWENVEEDDKEDQEEDADDDDDELQEDGGEHDEAFEEEEHSDADLKDVIEPLEFDNYPNGWNVGIAPGARLKLVRNPLAALHRLDEVTSFYNGKQSRQDGIFVLNINYSGNEMHQSIVRVLFRENENGFVQKLYEWERREEDASSMDVTVCDSDHLHIKFLVYHGYLQLSKA